MPLLCLCFSPHTNSYHPLEFEFAKWCLNSICCAGKETASAGHTQAQSVCSVCSSRTARAASGAAHKRTSNKEEDYSFNRDSKLHHCSSL